LIDTAAMYANEAGVGAGVRASRVAREEVFVTTKLGNDSHGFEAALRAFDASLEALGFDYVDLYLIHWPAPRQGRYPEAWRALMRLREEGRARSIGVSNFTEAHLTRLADETGVTPAIDQVELHPRFQQRALREFAAARGIVLEAWSPLGQGGLLRHPLVRQIAEKHARTPAQALIRWHLDCGHVAIPKSGRPGRVAENFDVFDFYLDDEDMTALEALDDPAGRIGPDPARFG
jgi:2,5-diketo-D-gluconate reductase A